MSDIPYKLKLERRLTLNIINRIEDETGQMFHKLMPEIDDEFHTTEDLTRIKSIRVSLAQYFDQLTMD